MYLYVQYNCNLDDTLDRKAGNAEPNPRLEQCLDCFTAYCLYTSCSSSFSFEGEICTSTSQEGFSSADLGFTPRPPRRVTVDRESDALGWPGRSIIAPRSTQSPRREDRLPDVIALGVGNDTGTGG